MRPRFASPLRARTGRYQATCHYSTVVNADAQGGKCSRCIRPVICNLAWGARPACSAQGRHLPVECGADFCHGFHEIGSRQGIRRRRVSSPAPCHASECRSGCQRDRAVVSTRKVHDLGTLSGGHGPVDELNGFDQRHPVLDADIPVQLVERRFQVRGHILRQDDLVVRRKGAQ